MSNTVKQTIAAISRWSNGIAKADNLALRLFIESLDHIKADGQKTPLMHLMQRATGKYTNRFVSIAAQLDIIITPQSKDNPAVTVTGIGKGWNEPELMATLRQMAKTDRGINSKEVLAVFPRPEKPAKAKAKVEDASPVMGHNNPPEPMEQEQPETVKPQDMSRSEILDAIAELGLQLSNHDLGIAIRRLELMYRADAAPVADAA